MAVTVSVGPLAFVFPFSPGISWIPFWREKVSEAQFLFPKRKRELPFEHGAKRLWRKSPARPGVEDLNGGDPAKLGRRPFKPQTVLLRSSRAVGRDDIRHRRTELRKTSGRASKNGYS
jgi:hypothetical protein